MFHWSFFYMGLISSLHGLGCLCITLSRKLRFMDQRLCSMAGSSNTKTEKIGVKLFNWNGEKRKCQHVLLTLYCFKKTKKQTPDVCKVVNVTSVLSLWIFGYQQVLHFCKTPLHVPIFMFSCVPEGIEKYINIRQCVFSFLKACFNWGMVGGSNLPLLNWKCPNW